MKRSRLPWAGPWTTRRRGAYSDAQVEVPFADGQRAYTRRFARYVVQLAERMTIRDVAQHLAVSWNLVKQIVKAALKRRFRKPVSSTFVFWPSMRSRSDGAIGT